MRLCKMDAQAFTVPSTLARRSEFYHLTGEIKCENACICLRDRSRDRSRDKIKRFGLAMNKWTIRDIAAEAGVSKSTVSRILNGQPDVDEETSARVLQMIERVGYVRSDKALKLAQGRANMIALVAEFDTSTWMVEVLRGAMGVASADELRSHPSRLA